MDDELLVVRAQLGERVAFAELVGRWHAPVWTFARRMLDEQRADDVAQEIWVAVLRGLPRLADPDPVPTVAVHHRPPRRPEPASSRVRGRRDAR